MASNPTYTDSSLHLEIAPNLDIVLGDMAWNSPDAERVEWLMRLQHFIETLVQERDRHDINPYQDTAYKGVYILGVEDAPSSLFQQANLAVKGVRQLRGRENLRRQFHRSLALADAFRQKLTAEEQELLQICPVYLSLENRDPQQFFQQLLFMKRIEGKTLGETTIGFSEEFCRVFQIPSLEEVRRLPQFAVHRGCDRQKHRQLIKIQTVYLFRHLWQRGIPILSLNQKNILVNQSSPSDTNSYTTCQRYFIIDPVADFMPPITPLYNLLSTPLTLLTS
ncbi:MAG: hypothetical protein MUF49_27240 [Oculatellaceae cyanobacterium Prado106]|jgi:hypothetical protein|nr:hypothetical protein [Oculatellaceae cyanobacterium Prado106]